MSQPIPAIIDKLLQNAIYTVNPATGHKVVVFRCAAHGPATNEHRPTCADCVECNTIIAFIRQAISTEDPLFDPKGDHQEALLRAVANAAQAEQAGELDLHLYPHAVSGQNLFVGEAAERRNKNLIVLTD